MNKLIALILSAAALTAVADDKSPATCVLQTKDADGKIECKAWEFAPTRVQGLKFKLKYQGLSIKP